MRMFASTTSRLGAAKAASLPACLAGGFVPTAEALLDEVVQDIDVPDRQSAPACEGVHALEVPDPLGYDASDDLAPLDFRMGFHLTVQLGRDRERDIRHRFDLCALKIGRA